MSWNGEQGMSGPTSMTKFEIKDGCWSKEYAELNGLCIQILNFLNEHSELSSTIVITKSSIISVL